MLNNDALLTLGVAVGSGEGSKSTVGGGGREFGRGPCRRTGVMLQEQSDGGGGCTSSGGCREFETAAKQETESSQMAKLRFCGADEARKST